MRMQRKHFLSILFGKSKSVSIIEKMNNKKQNYFNYDLFNIEKRKHFKRLYVKVNNIYYLWLCINCYLKLLFDISKIVIL